MARLTGSSVFLLSMGALGVGCGQIIGLGDYAIEEVDDGGGGRPGDAPVPCDRDEDCQENECATGTCEDGECAFLAVTAGTECMNGVCNGSTSSPACTRCIDDVGGEGQDSGCPEGAPQCRIDGDALCVGCESGNDCDDGNDCNVDTCTGGECHYADGCQGDTPLCDGNTCVECIENEDCDDGVECSTDTCDGGVCVRELVDEACPGFGEVPCVNWACTATGCESTTLVAQEVELLVDPNFDAAVSGWDELVDPDPPRAIVQAPAIGSAQSGANVAVLTLPTDVYTDLYQTVTLPDGTYSVVLSGWYKSAATDPVDATAGGEWISLGFWDYAADDLRARCNPTVEVGLLAPSWTEFSCELDREDVPPAQDETVESGIVEFNVYGDNNLASPHFTYYMDSVSVIAKYCE